MGVVLDIRNPVDLVTTYDQIEIQRSTTNTVAGMANIKTDLAISSANASDLSSGYTSYTDPDGTAGTHYYRFRYKVSGSGAVSSYSDIFLSGGSVLHTRFRRRMKDANTNTQFFSDDEIQDFLTEAVEELWPITWFETYTDSMIVPDGTTEIFNFSNGVTRVNSIDFIDSSGNNLGRLVNWNVRGKMILFDGAPQSGITVRCWVEKMFIKLAEVPEIWDSYLLNKMRLKGYETMEGDRSRYYKYNSVAKPEGGNLGSLDRIITRIEGQIERRERQIRRIRRPAFIKLV